MSITWVDNDCTVTGRVYASGYAKVPTGKRGGGWAHLVAWEKANGPIPKGQQIHHRCHNKACSNVEHLELLSAAEHRAKHRKCDHEDRYVRLDGSRSQCRVCYNRRRRERYANDPDFRARRLAGVG